MTASRLVFVVLSLLAAASAFAPVFQPARVVPGTAGRVNNNNYYYRGESCVLSMSDEKPAETAEEEPKAAPTSGTFYDDEVGRPQRRRDVLAI